jgi:hypothetical protein
LWKRHTYVEILFGMVSSSLLAYMLSEVKELRKEVNSLENRIIIFEKTIKKRSTDSHEDLTLA